MQPQYDRFREHVEKLEECKKELDKLKFERQSLQDRIFRLEAEKVSLKEKIESLTEYIQNIESSSRSKDDIIKSLSDEVNTYRKLLTSFVVIVLLLLSFILYLSIK